MMSTEEINAFVSWPTAPLTDSLVRDALSQLQLKVLWTENLDSANSTQSGDHPLLQWATYDAIDHEKTHFKTNSVLSSSYIFRKALIRKHFLARSIKSYNTKHPESILAKAVPQTWKLEISFADELDEMWGDDLWELGEQLDNQNKWWILKPGMADRGMGIRLFNSKDALQRIFEGFEDDEDDEDNESEDAESMGGPDTAVITSQLRHFVIQEYLSSPLLIDPREMNQTESIPISDLEGHKFHLRIYCVASGALSLYLYPKVLALFSSKPFTMPQNSEDITDLSPHLTNTSLQTHRGEEGVRLLEELIGCTVLSGTDHRRLLKADIDDIINQASEILANVFRAALATPVHFQPLPNAFEMYGVDFLVEHTVTEAGSSFDVKILEINAEPAIELTGPRLEWILRDLFSSLGKICVEPFFNKEASSETKDWAIGETRFGLRKCLDVQVRGEGNRG